MALLTLPGKCALPLVVDKGAVPTKDVGIVLMHGASGDHTSGHLPDTAGAFAASGFTIIRFALTTSLKKRAEACRAVVAYGSEKLDIKHWVLAGHSMGARVAVEVAATDPAVLACIFFSYPLHPPGKEDQLRDMPLCSLTHPLLFVRGTRDAFSKDAQFESARARLASSRVEVHTVEGGDHSLKALGGKAAAAAALSDARSAAVRFACAVADEGAGAATADRGPNAEAGAAPASCSNPDAGPGFAPEEREGDAEPGAAAARSSQGKAAAGGRKRAGSKGAPAGAHAASAEAKQRRAASGKATKIPVPKPIATAGAGRVCAAGKGAAGEDGSAKSEAKRKRPQSEGGTAKQKKARKAKK